jgi:trehalose 6-phosphate synthase
VTVVVSNRGPYQFAAGPDGTFTPLPGAGGLASALRPLLLSGAAGADGAWVAAALSDDDRAAVRAGAVATPGIRLTLLDLDPAPFRLAYDVVSNGTLWFLHHGLFDLTHRPRFDHRWLDAWAGYEAVNRAFADAASDLAEPGEVVLVQDLHLTLVPGMLRERRPDLRLAHFTHTAFCGPNSIRVLPSAAARALMSSMAVAPCGFHTGRWARAYEASARVLLGEGARLAPTFVAPLGPDPDALAEAADSAATRAAAAELAAVVGDRLVLLRVDRIDPSKNVLRGFQAYDRLLETHPEWRERVVFLARLNPSRETLAEYQAYRLEVELAAARVNDRWATGDWCPVVMDAADDYGRAVAALARYDVLLVNSVKDGLNLVAKEGPLVNQRDGVLCLSAEAGAWDELGPAAVEVHPFDVEQSAAALHAALAMPADERGARAARLRELAARRTPRSWYEDQLSHAA